VRKGAKDAPKVVPVPDDKAFGLRLQAIRKRRQMSQVEVAQQLGIHPSMVSQYERGYLRLHGALLVRMAAVLKTTPDEILAVKELPGTDEPPIDRRFLRRLKKVDKLSAHDKKLLLGTIDAFLSKVS
jgi:transcriptional regulator with XRE-family HTH domain